MSRIRLFTSCILILPLAACSSLAPLLASRTPTLAPAQATTSTPQANPTSTATPVASIRVLRVWVPPRFDPQAESTAADLFQQRLDQFQSDHPRIQLDVRVKSEADILNALAATSKAAPVSMPDLIALSHFDMQSAAEAGYLHPLAGLTEIMQDPDWYAFARELGHYQNTDYGLPFASDVLTFVYRPAAFGDTPANWETILDSGNQLAIPVSDPQSLFALSLYMSAGGIFSDTEGMSELDENILVDVLAFYQRSKVSGTFPVSVREFKTDKDTLTYYRAGTADMAVIRVSSDIQSRSGDYLPLLGLNDLPYTIGDGWVWSLAGSNTENQELAVELASYLVESDYLAAWDLASGFLPTRPQALEQWQDETLRSSMNETLQAAYLMPSRDVLQTMGPILQGALIRVFNGEQVEAVARSVMEGLK